MSMGFLDLFDIECIGECYIALIFDNTLCMVFVKGGRAVSLYMRRFDKLIVDYDSESGLYVLSTDDVYKAKAVRVLDKDESVVVLDRLVRELRG